mgnify:CR=1 FL=1
MIHEFFLDFQKMAKKPVVTITMTELFVATWPQMIIFNDFFDNELKYKIVFEDNKKWVFRLTVQQQHVMRSTSCKFIIEIPKTKVVMTHIVNTIMKEIIETNYTERTCSHVYFSFIPDLFRIYAFNNLLFQETNKN